MKKLLFIVFLLFSISVSSQEGYWFCKDYRVIDSTQGWRSGSIGLMIDFTNSKVMTLMKDTLIDVKIDKINKIISYEKDTLKLRYKLLNDIVEIKDDNIINNLYKFEFKKELNFSKDTVYKLLVSNKIKLLRDSIQIKFSNQKNWRTSYNSNIRVFESTFLNNEIQKGNWFLEKIKENLFLGFNFGFHDEIQYYRVTGSNDFGIDLEMIIENDDIPNLELNRIEFKK